MSFLARGRAKVPTQPVVEVGPLCAACHHPMPNPATTQLPGYDPQAVCSDPKVCREQAQAAGIWKVA